MNFKKQKYLLISSLFFLVAFVRSDTIERNLESSDFTDNSSYRNLIFQQFIDVQKYYYYDFYITTGGKVQIELLNYDLTRQTLNYTQTYPLQYRGSLKNFIIVQEMTGGLSILYYVLKIDQYEQGHNISVFRVNSKFDQNNFNFNDGYFMTNIIQDDDFNELLYVHLKTRNFTKDNIVNPGNIDVYYIDVKNQGDKLKTKDSFYFRVSKSQNIIGGNSRVLVEASKDQFWILKSNPEDIANSFTTFDKVNISSLTNLTIYPGGSHVYKLRGSYFQYASLSSDQNNLSTLVFHGYLNDKNSVSGEISLSSQNKIKIFFDSYSFFVAVSDNDVYSTIMKQDPSSKLFVAQNRSFKQTITDETQIANYTAEFKSALLIQQHEGKLFVLTDTIFSVYEKTKIYQIASETRISANDDLRNVLFTYMTQYYKSLNSN